MHQIFTYIYHPFEPNVGKYSIHGAFGGGFFSVTNKNTNLDQEIRHLHPPVGRQLEVRGGGGLYSKEWEAKNSFFWPMANLWI